MSSPSDSARSRQRRWTQCFPSEGDAGLYARQPGTGRPAIPLAEKNFEVTAVDPCREMLCLLEKIKLAGMKLRTVCSKMEDFKGNNFDFALCVFTVLLYLLDEESLKRA
ncbi:MAG: class I SAM-dependent methyltransferase [Clostridiaceae bacterium]|nr:class I SAM-dependent methyltransferase [Clostridiaceae bacterium]